MAVGTAGFSLLWLVAVAQGALDTDLLLWDPVFMLFSEGRNGCRHRITKTKSYCTPENLFGICVCLYRIHSTKLRKTGSSCEVL